MKIKIMLVMATAIVFVASTASAEYGGKMGDRFHYDREGTELFPDQEFTIDMFAAYTDPKEKFNDTFDTRLRGGNWGGGLGLNCFLTRNFGLGVDAIAADNGREFVDASSASIILRLPMDVIHLAPYAFGGGGYNFHGHDSWTAHAGVGLELRLNQSTGLFTDGRHVFAENSNTPDYALVRAGLRFAF
jgi:hypothetical protein